MKKAMAIMLLLLGLGFAAIFGFKAFKGIMIGRYMAKMGSSPITVSATDIHSALWQTEVVAAGSVRATLGVNITTTLGGMVDHINFTPGSTVNKGDLLVQLNIAPETAQLHTLQASAELAQSTYLRDAAQYKIRAISKATLDVDAANAKTTAAQVEQQLALIAQKTIRAPFTGRLGISVVNPGQYINPGDKITMLQTFNPIYVDFYVPQQTLSKIKLGESVSVQSDAFPGKTITGSISTIDPGLDPSIRNVEVEATIPNPDNLLVPGMFVSAIINVGAPISYLTAPLSAVTFNPYGAIVYVVSPTMTVSQVFVTTGDKRGDQVVVLKGLKENDKIVTSGQLKLRNGSTITIDNTLAPDDNPNPQPVDDE